VLKTLEPEALLRFAESINSMWSAVAYRYASFLGMSLRQRLEVVLGELAERFGVPDARGTLLLPELAQEELAQMIGSSRPMVSKLVTEMTESGILLKQGRRHILVAPKALSATSLTEHEAISSPAPTESGERARLERRAIRNHGAPAATI
jgi:biotin operon repressor